MQVGDMMAFMQYAMQIVFAFLMMSMMFIFLPRAAVSGDRIADVLETEPTITDPAGAPSSSRSRSRAQIEFRDVSFRYPGALTMTCCTTSASPPSPARPRPSSAPPAAANPPSST